MARNFLMFQIHCFFGIYSLIYTILSPKVFSFLGILYISLTRTKSELVFSLFFKPETFLQRLETKRKIKKCIVLYTFCSKHNSLLNEIMCYEKSHYQDIQHYSHTKKIFMVKGDFFDQVINIQKYLAHCRNFFFFIFW